MRRQKNLFLIPLSIAVLTLTNFFGGETAKAGSQAVDIYCVMRDGGNTHETSWQAAYISLKNERGGLFKISPRQAATIIVQQVVGNTEKYDDCIQFLGDLYPKPKPEDMIENSIAQDSAQSCVRSEHLWTRNESGKYELKFRVY